MNFSAYTKVSLLLSPSPVICQAFSREYIYTFLMEFSGTEGWYRLQTWNTAHHTLPAVEPCKGSKWEKAKANQENKIFFLSNVSWTSGLNKSSDGTYSKNSYWVPLVFSQDKKLVSEHGQVNPNLQERDNQESWVITNKSFLPNLKSSSLGWGRALY